MLRYLYFGAVGAGFTAAALASSCGSTEVTCEDLATCQRSTTGQDGGGGPGGGNPTGGGGAVGTGGGDATGGSGQGSDADAGCDSMQPPGESPCLNETIAILVSPKGNDMTATGRRGGEYKTIGAALKAMKSGRTRVYVCDDGTGYAEQLTLDATQDPSLDGISLYGGFECTNWTYDTTRRAKVNSPTGPALMLRGFANGTTIADFDLVAPAALPGASSFGAIVDTSTNVVLARVKVTAGPGGNGEKGNDGAMGADATPPPAGPQQAGIGGICPASSAQQVGGAWMGGPNACGSLGGNGGTANRGTEGSAGVRGMPGGANNGGLGGSGPGTGGADGTPGISAGPTAGVGSFSVAGYTVASPGVDGTDGSVGQGGGGGGASNATGTCIGASGGAGGMGGCGGKKGVGGASGGASVALLSWSSMIVLDHCELVAGNGGGGGPGGQGGLGGSGQPGAEGGPAFMSDAGESVAKGGTGGPGGNGGVGGSGAGGHGGPSYAMVYKGDSPSKISALMTHGNGGAGGVGGSQMGGVKAADGLVGEAANEFQVN